MSLRSSMNGISNILKMSKSFKELSKDEFKQEVFKFIHVLRQNGIYLNEYNHSHKIRFSFKMGSPKDILYDFENDSEELFNTLSRYPNCTYTLEPFCKISKTIKFQEIADHMEIFIGLLGIRLLVTKWHLERWKIDNVIHDYIEISELNNKLPTS